MDKRSVLVIALLCAVLLPVGGCVTDPGGDNYSRGESRQVMEVQFATVESVRLVRLEGTRSPVGPFAGAVVGGVIGSSIGRGRVSSTIGAVIGSVAGGIGGGVLEESATRSQGVEITVELDNGGYLAVVQADEGENFQPGDRVRLLGRGSAARVTR